MVRMVINLFEYLRTLLVSAHEPQGKGLGFRNLGLLAGCLVSE